MGKGKKNKVYENIEVVDIAAEGKSIAKIDNFVVFLNNKAIPGDVIDLKIIRHKRNYMEAIPLKFHKFSDKRAEPFCDHFGVCGGCKWQNLNYIHQLKYKEKQVNDNLERIGKINYITPNEIIPAEETQFYRNKLEFTFSNKRWLTTEEIKDDSEITHREGLGFHIPGMFDKVIDIEKCYLQSDLSNEIRLAVRDYAIEKGLTFFDIREQHGLMRNLIIRNSTINEVMVILSFYQDEREEIINLLEFLKDKFPQINSLMYVINSKPNDSISDQEILLFHGKNHIIEDLNGLKFKIGPKSFFQTNSQQTKKLYDIVSQFASFSGSQVVYDLYTGTGTIANYIAKSVKKVIGVDIIEDAIKDANENAKINAITNTTFVCGDMKDVFNEAFMSENGKPEVIIVDPPRAGLHKNVIQNLLYAQPERIVYVSCNPATQARDIELLSEDYKVIRLQPVDMFPHTHHVENVALLEKI